MFPLDAVANVAYRRARRLAVARCELPQACDLLAPLVLESGEVQDALEELGFDPIPLARGLRAPCKPTRIDADVVGDAALFRLEGSLDANMLTPIELIKATVDGMIARRFGRIVNITSAAVKAPIEILGLSNGARAGLTGFIAGLARKTVRHNVTINNLLPGPFETDRLKAVVQGVAKSTGRTVETVRKERMKANPAGRFGNPEEFGAACAFLCSRQAGFITGQNLLLDGGAFPGTL